MTQAHNISDDKTTVTLSISEHLLRAAQRRNIDLSQALEAYLCKELGENSGPDFCESYAAVVSEKQAETDTLKAYCKEHGQF